MRALRPMQRSTRSRRPPTLSGCAATMQAVIEHLRGQSTDLTACARSPPGSTQVPAGLVDAFHGARVRLQVYGRPSTCPIAVYTRAGGDQRAGSTGLPGLVCTARVVDDAAAEVAPGVAGEWWCADRTFLRILGNAAATADALPRLVSLRRHRPRATRTGTSSSRIARRI